MADTKFIRQKKEKNYTVLDNTFIKDCNLSWKAKGLMSYLLSLPDDWTIFQTELETHAKDGIDSLRSAIKELEENGYLEKSQNNNNGRFAGYSYKIYESPYRKNRIGKTVSEKPKTENPTLLNTNNKQSTNKQNTSPSSNEDVEKKKKLDNNAIELSNLLYQECKNQNDKFKVTDKQLTQWASDIEKINRIDGYDYSIIQDVLLWCKSDDFWSINIQSGSKFRKQFNVLYLKTKKENKINKPILFYPDPCPYCHTEKMIFDQQQHIFTCKNCGKITDSDRMFEILRGN